MAKRDYSRGSYDAGGGDPELEDYARSLQRTGAVREAEFRLGESNARALTDVSIARGAAAQDPFARAQLARGMDAYERINPARIDELGRDAGAMGQSVAKQIAARQAGGDAMVTEARARTLDAQAKQGGAVDALSDMAGKRAPSVADLAANQQRERGQAAVLSTMASGGYSPAAQAAAMRAIGNQGADIAGSTAIARAQEEQSALARDAQIRQAAASGYGALAEGTRGQQGTDLAATQQAQSGILGSTSAQAGLLGQKAQYYGAADQQRAALFDSAQRSRDAAENKVLAQMQARMGGPTRPGAGEMIGSGAGLLAGLGISAAGAFSDERVKRGVGGSGAKVDEMLSALSPKHWRYKDGYEDDGESEHTGVMAQDLERSDLGRTLVRKDADGVRIVDYSPRTIGPIVLAALGHLSQRIDEIEG